VNGMYPYPYDGQQRTLQPHTNSAPPVFPSACNAPVL
jgi:hypothetical protein